MRKNKFICIAVVSALCLLLCALASVAYGAKSVSLQSVVNAVFQIGESTYDTSVVKARIPRTVFGILAGASLGISGAMMQSITRNPIADPSILGVNTGASLFVVCGISFLHISTSSEYIWLAFAGASLTAAAVYGLASLGHGGATPIKLALAGSAANIALQSLVNTVMLPNTQVMDQFRFWQTGSISGATWEDIYTILPYIIIGLIASFLLSSSLNTLALGDETAVSLGLNTQFIRAAGSLCGVLLCACTTALAGPISFIGLMIPHLVRLLVGPDMRKIIPLSALSGACLLLAADVIGRLLGSPGELETGIVTAMMGAPVFILIVRKVKVRSL